MVANNRPTKKLEETELKNGKCYPPFIDAYKEFFESPISFRDFKEAFLSGAMEWGDQAVGKLFLNQVISSLSDLEHTPVYIGYFGDKSYGAFAKVKDGYLDYESFQIREYGYPQEWDVT